MASPKASKKDTGVEQQLNEEQKQALIPAGPKEGARPVDETQKLANAEGAAKNPHPGGTNPSVGDSPPLAATDSGGNKPAAGHATGDKPTAGATKGPASVTGGAQDIVMVGAIADVGEGATPTAGATGKPAATTLTGASVEAKEEHHKRLGVTFSPVLETDYLITNEEESPKNEFGVSHPEQGSSCLTSLRGNLRSKINKHFFLLCSCISIVIMAIILFIVIAAIRKNPNDNDLQNLVIRKSDEERWAHPNVTAYLYVYLFTVGTAVDTPEGDEDKRLTVSEKGPYVYKVDINKVDVTWNDDNSTVSYRDLFYMYFEPDLSIGPEGAVISILNMPLLTLQERLGSTHPMILKLLLSKEARQITQSLTVKDVLFGYESKVLQDLETYDLLHLYHKSGDSPFIPGYILTRNGTKGPVKNVHTGASDINQLNEIYTLDYKRFLDCWATEEANAVRGTDGLLFRPRLNEDSKLTLFDYELFRKFDLEFSKETSFKGLDTLRFIIPDGAFSNSSETDSAYDNIGNGYCVPTCLPDGAYSLLSCEHELKAYISLPHFLGADPYYRRLVKGLSPNEAKHRPTYDVDKATGVTVNIHHRYQINLHLKSESVPEVYLPVLWSDMSIQLNDEEIEKISDIGQENTALVDVALILIAVVGVVALVLIARVVMSAVTYYQTREHYQPVITPEPNNRRCGCWCCTN